jgi:hypothetical protein
MAEKFTQYHSDNEQEEEFEICNDILLDQCFLQGLIFRM